MAEPAGKGEQLPMQVSAATSQGAAIKGKEEHAKEQCSYWKLYSKADAVDYALMLAGIIGACGGGVLLPLFTIVFGDFVNAFGNPEADFTGAVRDISLKFTYIAIAALAAMYLEVACFVMAGERQTNRVRMAYLKAVLSQDVAFFDTAATTGSLLQGLNEDSISFQAAISDKASNFVHHSATFVSGFIIAFTRGWDMTLVMLGCLPFLAAMGAAISTVAGAGQRANAASYSRASTIAQQAISSVRTVAAYNGQQATTVTYQGALEQSRKAGLMVGIMTGMSLGGMQFIMYCSYAVALFYGAYRIAAGKYTGGQVINVQLATLMASFALGQASPNLQHFASGRVAGFRIFSVIERKPHLIDVAGDAWSGWRVSANGQLTGPPASSKSLPQNGASTTDVAGPAKGGAGGLPAAPGALIKAADTTQPKLSLDIDHAGKGASGKDITLASGAGTLVEGAGLGVGELASVEGHLELSDVHFAYPARPDIPVFRGFSLVVPAGHTVALVGSSGSGKSTAVQLIERFYDPDAGCVLLDGVDLRTLGLTWLRKQMGLVSQEPTLFATTIYENIAIGRPGATRKEVAEAAVAANAHKFIRLLPGGYDTQVGEKGVQLSGGQKQRIAIARAILKNPKVLLLDEATSALDTASERVVQAALDRMVVGRTTVVVAHRLSTIQHAHAIAVVSQGTVIEQGPHAQLINKPNGAYALLVQMQMQKDAQEQQQRQESVAAGAEAAVAAEQGVPEAEEGLEETLSGEERREAQEIVAANLEAAASSAQRTSSAASGVLSAAPRMSPFAATTGAPTAGGEMPPAAVPSGLLRAVRKLSLSGTGAGAAASADGAELGSDRPSRKGSLAAAPDSRTPPGSRHGSAVLPTVEVVVAGARADRASSLTGVGPDKGSGKPAKLSEKEQEKLDEEAAKAIPAKRLFYLNRPEWPALLAGMVGSAGAGLQHPAMAFVFSDMISIFFLTDMDELKRKASFYAWMFFVIACGATLSVALQQVGFSWAGMQLAVRIRIMLLGALLRQEVAFFDDDTHNSGRLTSALATDAAYIRGAVGDALGVALQNLSTLVAGYIIAFIYNWQMALLVTGTFPLSFLSMFFHMKFAMGGSGANDQLYGSANQFISEAFSSIRVIHAYNLQSYILGKYAVTLEATRPVLRKQAHVGGIAMGFGFCFIFALYALVIWFGGWQVDHGTTDLNGMLKGFFPILMAAMGMAQAAAAFPDLGKAKGAVGRVFPLLDRQPAIDPDAPGDTLASDQVQGEVEFRDIKFAYPSRPNVVIYHNFNLRIPAGQVYALVGESGSGKSTVVSLLERFYDPLQGSVLLDGRDIRAYNLKWLRQQIGLVSQEPILFAGTVTDNIKYGAPDASIEEVEAAARTANAHEFVVNLPEGYATVVGEGGIQLSGGQKQRIAIARAVIKNPKVLLLDEATSALDARSERVVQDALDVVMAGRTCLVIAHRLSTIKNAHAINVLYKGAVLEQGTHAELMANPEGAYAKLVQAQQTAHAT